MRFRYTSLAGDGRLRRGLVEAASPAGALEALKARGETAVRISSAGKTPWRRDRLTISRDALVDFLTDLAALHSAGVPLRRSLDILSGEASTPAAAQVARLMAERLDAGSDIGLAARIESEGDLALAAELARAGEASGRLGESLRFAADLLERQSQFSKRVLNAIAYPAFLMALSVAAIVVLALVTGPALMPLIEESPDASPALRGILSFGVFLQAYFAPICLAAAGVFASFALALRSPRSRMRLAQALARSPGVRPIVRDLNCGAFARVLGGLLAGGTPAVTALTLAANTAPNPYWRAKFLSATGLLRNGRTIAGALGSIPDASPEVKRLARVGEESGALGDMLGRAGDLVMARALRRLDRIAALAGPALILVMGGFIGWLMTAFLGGLSNLGAGAP